ITALANVKPDPNAWVTENYPGIYMVMGNTAEVVAKRYQIGREVQDEYALASQQRIARAQREGFFDEEIAPIRVSRAVLDKKTGAEVGLEEHDCRADECNRSDT